MLLNPKNFVNKHLKIKHDTAFFQIGKNSQHFKYPN